MKTRSSAVLKAVTVAAAMSGAVITAPAGPAGAYAGSCVGPVGAGNVLQVREFSLQDVGDGSSLATVAADVAVSQEEAQKFLDDPGPKPDFMLFGEDGGTNDLLTQFKPERTWVSPSGLSMRGAITVPNSTLNEDGFNGFPPRADAEYFKDDRNEYFVDIRMRDIRTGGALRVESCRLQLPR